MADRIAQALTKLFERHRIVFWYDAKQELRAEYEAVALSGIEKLELRNNEYGVKYRILRQQPEQKFLLFHDGPQPEDLGNWLLDVLLAHGEFRADKAALWLSELELGQQFADLAQVHVEFFRFGKRREALKRLLQRDDTDSMIKRKMLAVCAGSDPRMDAVLECLLQELADGRDEKMKLIGRCGLEDFLWDQMTRCYGYKSDEPGIRDFVITLFKSCYAMGTDGQVRLTGDALVFLKHWKDSRQFEAGFERLSGDCAEVLGMEQDLGQRDFRVLLELDYFRLIDLKIISDLVREVAARTVSSNDVSQWVRQRRLGHWYREYRHLYEAVDCAAQFMELLALVSEQWAAPELQGGQLSLALWVEKYTTSWYLLDQLYRKFICNVRLSGQASLMDVLTDQVEALYSNSYLLKVNDRWQHCVDALEQWQAMEVSRQDSFFADKVRPFLQKDNKVCVIISDALRYEIGEELLGRIRQEDRYHAELSSMLSMLPSYTQLGMAALLPHQELRLADNETGCVLVDGFSSQGTANRSKILAQAQGQCGVALKAEEVMALNKEDSRALVRDNDVLYVYHNRIDAVGDKQVSEDRVFEEVDKTLDDLVQLVKKLNNANVYNFFITADHGFIYQHRPLDESDFSGAEAKGTQIVLRDRRFVLGKGLKETAGLRRFSSSQLGLVGEVEVLIPKSINRLRLKGSGSRFVHGGASLQEVVIPVIRINKKRQSDVSVVEVEILRGASSLITSGQVAVVLYQAQAVTDKVQPRHLRAGFYTESGELVSDSHELSFDRTSDNPRDREQTVRFVLSRKADDANGQDVILKLEERHAGTSHFKEYKTLRYTLRRSFARDFDL